MDDHADEADAIDVVAEEPSPVACVDVADLRGACIGDDVSKKPLHALRLVAVQAGGVCADWRFWGQWWARALTTDGADVASIAEVGFPTNKAVQQATQGLAAVGWRAIGSALD